MDERRYQNTGAPFRATNGDFIARGQVFVPSSQDLAQRAHKLRRVDSATETGAPRAARGTKAGKLDEGPPRWAGFPGIEFASHHAHEAARDAGLGPVAFEDVKGSGADGAYTVADIRAILGED